MFVGIGWKSATAPSVALTFAPAWLLHSDGRQLSQMEAVVLSSPQVPALRRNEVLLLTGA